MSGTLKFNFIALIFFLFSLILGFSTIEKYGVMNDAPIKYASGFRNYYFFTTGNIDYLDPKNTPHLAKDQNLLEDHQFLDSTSFNPVDYSPLLDVLSVLTCNLFHRKLGWFNYFDAHNSSVLILFAFLCGWFYLFSVRVCGFIGGVSATILFILFPRLLAHSHNNLSDIPLVFFFFATIVASCRAVYEKKPSGIIFAAFFYGLTIATKLNGAFLVFILIPWYLTHKFLKRYQLTREEKFAWAASPFVCYAGWILTFPYFWTSNSISEFFLRQKNSHIFTMLTNENIVNYEGGWNLSVFSQAFATTPTLCLIFFASGFIISFRRLLAYKDSTFVLLFLWLFVPIFKSSLPGIKNYEMIRHFINFIPPLLLFCGLGAGCIIEVISKSNLLSPHSQNTKIASVVLIFILAAIPVARIHPYEILYFNNIFGGLSGAKKQFMYAYDYWQTSLRTMITWLNINARVNSKTTMVSYFKYNVMEPAILRKDLKMSSPLQGERFPVKLNLPGNRSVSTEMKCYRLNGYFLQLIKPQDTSDLRIFLSLKNLKSEYELTIEDQTIAKVYDLDENICMVRDPKEAIILQFSREGILRKTSHLYLKNIPRHY